MEQILNQTLQQAFLFSKINSKFWGIEIPVNNILGHQTVYATKLEDNFFRLHDGGETLGTAAQSQNILSSDFEAKLISVCKAHGISKHGNILSVDCNNDGFKTALLNLYACITLLHA